MALLRTWNYIILYNPSHRIVCVLSVGSYASYERNKTKQLHCLVDFDVPLLGLLQLLDPDVVVDFLLGGNSLEHVLDTRHHSSETTEVDVGPVLELLEDLVGVFLDLVLDVHLSSVDVGLFTGKSVVNAEVVGVLLLGFLEFVVVKKGVRVGNSEEQPGLSLVGTGGGGVLRKQTADESTVRGNSSSGGNHDEVGLGVLLGHEHDLSGGSGHGEFVTGGGVAQEVGADSLLGWVVGLEFWAPVGGTTNAKGSGLSGHVVSVTGGGDGVKTNRVGLSVLFSGTRGDDTPRLSLPVREVTFMIDDDVASFSGGGRSNNALGGDNLSGVRGLVLVDVHGDGGLVIVWLGLEEILSGNLGAEGRLGSRGKGGGRSQDGCEAECGLHFSNCYRKEL
mmetsp:Transcript_8162/g.18080  ORF Transcript_8162/g.18080 Transcript_8162/m.18080 type:complete len:391 (-) Transcript_8162:65-1237(-)